MENKVLATYNLGENLHLQVLHSRGEKRIDIRKWDNARNPTKNGVSLTLQRFVRMLRFEHEVLNDFGAIKVGTKLDVQRHIGGPLMLSINGKYKNAQLSEWYIPSTEQKPRPSYKGLSLSHGNWLQIMGLVPELMRNVSDLATTYPCFLHDDHQNQQGALRCRECTPWGDDNVAD